MPSTQTKPFFPEDVIERTPCARCGTEMVLASIEPEAPGTDLRTFKCPQCNHTETFTVPFRK